MKNQEKPLLSMKELFQTEYKDTSFSELCKDYNLKIEQSQLQGYEHYTPSQLREHYDIESNLAKNLMRANKKERLGLYTSLYDQLFQKLPFHPQLKKKNDLDNQRRINSINSAIIMLTPYLSDQSVFMELGPGDCELTFAIAKKTKKAIAVDVSNEITKSTNCPDNFELILSDGSSIEVPEKSVDIAFSSQLMEHLHPDDAMEQLQGVYASLAPGGVYLLNTPNKLAGPADISRFFSAIPQGFHLKEYSNLEIWRLLKTTGFNQVYAYKRIKGKYRKIPVLFVVLIEKYISFLPRKIRRAKKLKALLRFIDIRMLACK